jgi:hypothetical protein
MPHPWSGNATGAPNSSSPEPSNSPATTPPTVAGSGASPGSPGSSSRPPSRPATGSTSASWTPGGDAGKRIALPPWPEALDKWDRNHDRELARDEIADPEILDRYFRMDLDRSGRLNEAEWNRHAEVFRRARNALLAIRPPAGAPPGTGPSTDSAGDEAILWSHTRGVPYVASPPPRP